MGWNFRGLYTVDTAPGRAWLTADEVVRGSWAEIPASAVPDAGLPEPGLLVVHGFGPEDGDVPWDAFWAAGPVGAAPLGWDRLDRWHRPPRTLLAWMRELRAASGVPVALYQCVMHGGDIDLEVALLCDAHGTRVVVRGSAPSSPLLMMLRLLGGTPRQWQFAPHEQEFPAPLDPPAATLARLSLSRACRAGDVSIVDDLLRRGADRDDGLLCVAAEHGHAGVVERLLRAGTPLGTRAFNPLGHAANPRCARLLRAAGAPLEDRPSPLATAAWRGYGDTVRYLVKQGATVDLAALFEPAAQGGIAFLVARALAEDVPVDRQRGLVVAAVHGRRAVVDLLLAAGVTPGPVAVHAAASGGHTGILRVLLAHGGDPAAARDGSTLPVLPGRLPG